MKISQLICKMLHVLNLMTKKKIVNLNQELESAQTGKNTKSPGYDGFRGELYKWFWKTIRSPN